MPTVKKGEGQNIELDKMPNDNIWNDKKCRKDKMSKGTKRRIEIMSKMIKNVESKEIYLKLLFFEKTVRYYIINPRIFNWRNLPVSTSTFMCPCPCQCPWTQTWTGTHGRGHLLSAIIGGELQEHDMPVSTSMSMGPCPCPWIRT
jgi:hypothetical protein